jgi:hypothetical protein
MNIEAKLQELNIVVLEGEPRKTFVQYNVNNNSFISVVQTFKPAVVFKQTQEIPDEFEPRTLKVFSFTDTQSGITYTTTVIEKQQNEEEQEPQEEEQEEQQEQEETDNSDNTTNNTNNDQP